MAEGGNVTKKSLAQLEREITCAICQDRYTEPKLMPCSHYFCKDCILKVVLRVPTGKPFSCPECLEEVLPKGGVDKLQTAFFLNCIKATIATLEEAHGEVVQDVSLARKCPPTRSP